MNTNKELLGLAESLVKYGRKKGADEVEVNIGLSREFSVDVRNGDIEKLQEAGDKGLSIQIIKDKKELPKILIAQHSTLPRDMGRN